jgi:hypothetical protein
MDEVIDINLAADKKTVATVTRDKRIIVNSF